MIIKIMNRDKIVLGIVIKKSLKGNKKFGLYILECFVRRSNSIICFFDFYICNISYNFICCWVVNLWRKKEYMMMLIEEV